MRVASDVLMIAALVAAGASVIAVMSRRATRTRWRRLLRDASRSPTQPGAARPDPSSNLPNLFGPRDRPVVAASRLAPPLVWTALRHGRRHLPAVAAVGGAAAGLLVGGPVAGLVLAAYAGAGTHLAVRSATARARGRSRSAAVEAVATLAAELRAGVTVGTALSGASPFLAGPAVVGEDAATVSRRVASAVDVAESSGAPLADVLDRLDAHLRAVSRARANADAQAAGARASALLLALMPVAGAGLGFLVGIDPLHTLLYTPLGAACLVGAVLLQLGGLAWAGRLSRVVVAS